MKVILIDKFLSHTNKLRLKSMVIDDDIIKLHNIQQTNKLRLKSMVMDDDIISRGFCWIIKVKIPIVRSIELI